MLENLDSSVDSVAGTVKVQFFEQTSSTKLELQTLLWALKSALASPKHAAMTITAYTDSQNIVGLPARQAKLGQSDYFSSKGKRLNNYELYQEFYQLTAKLNCQFIKVKGHQPSHQKTKIDKFFGLVDQQSRKALREAQAKV